MSERGKTERPAAQQAILDKLQPSMDTLYEQAEIDEEQTEAYTDSLMKIMDQAKRDKDIELYKRMHVRVCGRPVEIYWEYIPKDHNLFIADAEAWF